MKDTAELQAHIDALAAEHGIVVDQRRGLAGMMYVEEVPPRVEIPTLEPWEGAPSVNLCYMVALHEIGHCVGGHTQGRPPYGHKRHYFDHGVLRCEAEAWNFALDECRVRLHLSDCDHIASRYIGSYIARARAWTSTQGPLEHDRLSNGDRHHVEFTWDDPDDPFVQETLRMIWRSWKPLVTT